LVVVLVVMGRDCPSKELYVARALFSPTALS
jgi:hypothetical protein